jgi:hypothetical protein
MHLGDQLQPEDVSIFLDMSRAILQKRRINQPRPAAEDADGRAVEGAEPPLR